MSRSRVLHLTISTTMEIDQAELRRCLDGAQDWIQYIPGCILLYTRASPKRWFELVRPHIGPRGRALVIEVDPYLRYGNLPRSVWQWLDAQIARIEAEEADEIRFQSEDAHYDEQARQVTKPES